MDRVHGGRMTILLDLTHREKCAAIEKFNLHCSLAEFDALAAFFAAALAQFIAGDGKEQALQRMHENEVEMGLHNAEEK
jgi:hypothetical protein